ncbi:MAG: hypothetical protein DMF82_02840 [Acidobacteria bacterium]|nr:MAG: hypothetical protein DMF82_02840 [Acidobacteriota bacterium]
MEELRRAWPAAVLVALAAAGTLLLVPDARAERRCEEDPAISGRICSEAECILLSDAVHAPDACGGVSSCEDISGCSALTAMRQKWLNCYTRRITVNARCWSNFDLDHQWQAAEAIRHVGVCDERMKLPQPEGCADPCPEE